MKRVNKSAIVTVMAVAGVVGFDFGSETGILSGGMGKAFGEEADADLPDVMRGFAGILQGKIVDMAEGRLVLQIEKVDRTWKTNKAKNADASVGQKVSCRVHPRATRIRERLGEFKVGDSVVTGAVNREGNILSIAELLIKTEDYPALRAKWDEAARKRKERESGKREEAAAALPDAMRGFSGILQGKILKKLDNGFVFQIEKVDRTWKNNRAKHADASVGKTVSLRLHPRGKHIREQLGKMEVGDSVVIGAINREGNVLMVNELLVKAEEYPELRAKWDRARKERGRKEGEREGADR